jgi:phospholipid transport system substrate-binding protein
MKNGLSRRQILGLALAVGVVGPSPAWAAVSAGDYVHNLGVEVIKLANGGKRGDKALQQRFAALLNRYISIPTVANFALGQNVKSLPPGDKAKFYDLVSNYAAALFVWYVDDFKGTDLTITGSAAQGSFTTVDSTIAGSTVNSEKLRWRVSGSGGAYRVADLNIKGVWLSIAMKKLFLDTLNASKGDFQPLYAKLREAETW